LIKVFANYEIFMYKHQNLNSFNLDNNISNIAMSFI
jgi:hypothetical protein